MAPLSAFSQEEKDIIIRLPYHAGYWLSRADDTGGEEADAMEKLALHRIIKKIADGDYKTGFIHIVFAGLYMKKSQWKSWEDDAHETLEECGQIIALIKDRLPEKDVNEYRDVIMKIAIEVARAFQEYEQGASIWGKIYAKWELVQEKIMRLINPRGTPDIVVCPRISPEERRALRALHRALYVE